MALSGSYNDLYVRQYTDMIEHELQQKGSRLRGLVNIETAMGERRYFNKLGKLGSYTRTSRLEAVQLQDQTNERRFVTPTYIEAAVGIDDIDLIRYQRSPQPELAEALALELGRQMDTIIINALGGSAEREVNGSFSAAAFDATNFQIAVNSNSLAATSMSGDTGLHEGKLIQAKQKLLSAYATDGNEELYVVGPAKQLAGMLSRAFASDSAAYMQGMPQVNLPGLEKSLDGLLGMRFIMYEDSGTSSGDQYVYVFPKSAVKLGVWKDINFRVDDRVDMAGGVKQVKANMAIGAVRMFEEKVVRILCDPTPAYA